MSPYGIKEFLGDLSGYRSKYLDLLPSLDACSEDKQWLISEMAKRDDLIRQLKLLTPRPTPPEITYVTVRDTLWIQHEINAMGLAICRVPLDMEYRLTNQSNMNNIVAWDATDQIRYIREKFDCENFAILFKAMVDLYFHLNQVAIIMDYISHHSYNLILYPNCKHQICEAQSDGLYLWTKRITDFYSMKGSIAIL